MSRGPAGRPRKGSAGHRDRKPITQHHIARPVVQGAARALKRGGRKGLQAHLETLTPWEQQTLDAARSESPRV